MDPEQGSVLIVDDEAGYRAMLRYYLESKGFAVTDAEDGDRALEWVGKRPFDLVLLDVLMPGLGGLEVLRSLRRMYSMTDLPVIMGTAKDQSADVVEALRLGANDYLTKPFDFPVVLARVQTQLSLKRSVDRITRLERSLEQRNGELEAANAELVQANGRMKRELEAAARVQQALLPAAPPQLQGFGIAWKFRPCTELAGDLLDVVMLGDRHVGLYVLDVVDHGVKAALLAVMVSRSLVQLLTPVGRPRPIPPAEVAAHLNSTFPWDSRTQQFFTLLYGVLDLVTGEFRYVSAGHPGPLHLARGGEPWLLDVPGLPIGLGDETYRENSLTLGPGDRLYLYSDGLTDAMNEEGKRFGSARLLSALKESRAMALPDGLATLLRGVEEWCGRAEPYDDISILAVERA
jgi:sigma-B regulation protein RsbU (phosphoserine phosphatase)